MSMILQNLMTNTASVPVAKMSSSTTAAMTGTGFNQSLSYAMSSTGAAGTTSAAATGSTLAGLMGSAASLLETIQAMISGEQEVTEETEQEQVQKVNELLDNLLDKLQKMDEAITSDPALMQSLQTWIVQVQQVLTGQGTQESNTDASSENGLTEVNTAQPAQLKALPVLAQQADTLRFAVADAVSQVVEKLQAVQTGTQQADPKLEQLMTELQNILQKSNSSNGHSSTQGDANQSNQQQQATIQIVEAVDESKPTVRAEATAATASTSDSEASTSTADTHQPVTVTAGQLAMRTESTPLVGAVQPKATVNSQNLANDMSTFIVNKMDIHKLNGVSEARIILNPESLGMIDIKITIQDGQVLAQFLTEKHGAKDLLEQQMSQLRSALQSQGLHVDKLEVAESSSLMADMYNNGQGFGSDAGQQQGRRSKSKEEQNDDALLTAELGNELSEWREERREAGTSRVGRMMNYGSTYVARA